MTATSRVRVSIIGVVVLALFGALFTRLWYLQGAGGTSLAAAATENRVRIVTEPAPRGRILDANGRVLADSRVSNAVTVDRALEGNEREEVIVRLALVLGMSIDEINERLDDPRVSPYSAVPVAVDVAPETLVYIGEHNADFPGVTVDRRSVRAYPNGTTAAHVLGYTGEISEEEIDSQRSGDYSLGDQIGKAGVEQSYERDLRGTPGEERLEIDAQGDVVRSLGTTEPEPGSDVQLTIDLDVQTVAEVALAEAMAKARGIQNDAVDANFATYRAPAGSVVVLDARTGSVVAMVSNPAYDPNQFVDGIPTAVFEEYENPASYFPLLNRTIQGQYAPGSTFKLVTSLAALTTGQINTGTVVNDKGCIDLEVEGGKFCNAGGAVYGTIALSEALTVSSDVFFYELGRAYWRVFKAGDPNGYAIQDEARALGFGSPTGIPLTGESPGRVPDEAFKIDFNADNPDPKAKAENSIWLPGDNIQLAVGQGDLLVTPLQLASAYATLGNGGTVFTPRLASQVLAADGSVEREISPIAKDTVVLPPGSREAILDGLRGVVRSSAGTAGGVFAGFDFDAVDVAGKTGTAVVDDEPDGKQDTSVFVAITPPDPAPGQAQYVIVALVEEGGFGADTAAPIVRRVIEGLYGLTPTEILIARGSVED